MRIKNQTKRLFLNLALFAASVAAMGADFTNEDLQKMVRELEAVAGHPGDYNWPIECRVEKNDQVNAYATAIDKKDGKKPQATMVVFTGLVDLAKGDLNLIRAVVAHEVAHLELGHCRSLSPAARDLSNLWTRQQEHAADIQGAILLQKAGYKKQHMVDMLMMLDKMRARKGDWLGRLTADHADPKARAAEIADNKDVMRSLLMFDVGLAYMDCRRYKLAADFFAKASELEPKLTEAYVNEAYCRLYNYYDYVPRDVRTTWFTPDFGPVLTEITSGVRGVEIGVEDLARYKLAVLTIGIAKIKAPSHPMVAELEALAKVLDPEAGHSAQMLEGARAFEDMANKTSDKAAKLRYAANAGVGFQRGGDLQKAYDVMIVAQKQSDFYNAALAESIGRIKVTNRAKETASLAVDVMATWLARTPQASPYWQSVKKNLDEVCKELSIDVPKLETTPIYLCKVVSIFHSGKEVGMFMPQDDLFTLFGKADLALSFDERYPDLMEIRWSSGDFAVFTERGKALRLTSYTDGDYLYLRPKERTIQGVFQIKVGMTEEEFGKILNVKGGASLDLAKGGKIEKWLYYPGMNMGVYLDGGKIKGITVTAVEDE
ncbi:MAG: M48 family metallopeptidase [Armatimonadetes bacterium]|nr:M48 family metallopeptidase [Armatimonadota bacterium]